MMKHIPKGRLLTLAAAATTCVAAGTEEIGQHKIEKTSAAISLDARCNDACAAVVAKLDASTTLPAFATLARFNSDKPLGLQLIIR